MTGKKVIVDGRVVEVLGPRLGRRFALNTDRLPEFLAGQEIPDDWAPSEEKEQCDFINNLVQAARESGVLAGPGPLSLVAIYDENPQWDFYWEYIVDNAAHGLRPIVPLARTGSLGVEAVTKVLVDACERFNSSLDKIDAAP